jgi:acyl transferase domain-containing protein/3-hydroxymyristoyl/3-hydroxydecanoyl-(acyl carrier protein) dehydratase
MSSFSPIAIVGQGCVLPGALSPAELWSVVRDGRSTISAPPPEEWRLEPSVDRAALMREIANERGGYVRGFEDVFDPLGFNCDPKTLDPVFTWTLHSARQALESAGLGDARSFPGGIVVLGNLSYPVPALVELAIETWGNERRSTDPRNRFMSGLPAQLTAQALGFGRGGFALDAACASSLYAIKLACDRLHDGSADIALAGGVNHAESLFLHLGFTALAAESKTGQSRPFHRHADGLVAAHGAAMVVLKRLEDALAAGLPILGVIRGVGLSNDGRGRGLLVPMESGQVRAMRAAYAESGLTPADISLVECHATGTPVGDATEVRSMRSVFSGARDVPIGSLKSNVGHLITASGAAALLKVLAAMRAGVRPATLNAEEPLPDLDGGPLRLLQAAEPWDVGGPRRAAISNFGFGGNNAHLIVEEWSGAAHAARSAVPARAPAAPAPAEDVAVVAQAVLLGDAVGERAFEDLLFEEPARTSVPRRAGSFELDIAQLRFPPSDLKAAIPQQTVLLRLATELDEVLRRLPAGRTGLLVGMQCDAEVARCSLRWRREGATAGLSTEGPLTAALVVGCMPNIVANRVGSHLDYEQPTFSVSAEEASGNVALELAVRSLRARETDAAVVGAVDLSCEPVHEAAAARVSSVRSPADAAVLMVLKRLEDARRDGDRVLAVIPGVAKGPAGLRLEYGPEQPGLTALLGHSHAATGLLHVAAAVAACHRRALPRTMQSPALPFLPQDGERRVSVEVETLGGTRVTIPVRAEPSSRAEDLRDSTRLAVFTAKDEAELLRALERGEERPGGELRVAIVAQGDAELAQRTARAIALLRARPPQGGGMLDEGIFFGRGRLSGELAFVFTGPAGAYPQMGRELGLALPELIDSLSERAQGLRDAAGWLYHAGPAYRASPQEKLWGSSYLIQLHAELTRGLLGLRPQATIGYCAGETNALFAMGAWNDLDGFRREIAEQAVYSRELGGEFRCVERAWGLSQGGDRGWTAFRARASVVEVKAALAEESRAHLTIINAPSDVVVAGEPAACARVAAKLGQHRVRNIEFDFVMHCPEAREFEATWRALHHRPTAAVPGVRFYTHATLSSYSPTSDAVADALTGQAMNVVDFPAMIERAYADGVRVFVEHGPHGGCSKWIDEVLGEREHLAVALDRFGRSAMLEAAEAVARLVVAGVEVHYQSLVERLRSPRQVASGAAPGASRPQRSTLMSFPAHLEPVTVPAHSGLRRMVPLEPATSDGGELMAPAPSIPVLDDRVALAPDPEVAAASTGGPSQTSVGSPRRAEAPREQAGPPPAQAELAAFHVAFLRQQAQVHAQFLALALGQSATGGTVPPAPVAPAPVAPASAPTVVTPVAPAPVAHASAPTVVTPVAPAPVAPAPVAPAPVAPATVASSPRRPWSPSGPSFGRAELEVLASDKISRVFGPLFEQQDGYVRQVRMPEPPLLLADRVLGIAGEPGTLGLGTIWTETDVRSDSWYLHQGRMPAGILVESGQADLLLISWLGIDFLNRGERVYRLLGCELTAHGELPRVGDTLTYEIHVDGHANQGDIRLFFFHYDCWVNGELRVTVRGGQAGFFTDEELANSAGVLWRAEDAAPTPSETARLAPPLVRCAKDHFTREDITAFARGDGYSCFGPGFERLASHTLSPSIQSDRMRLIDEVTHFELDGGPWGRGYLRGRLELQPDHWFFGGHFKNDPCMPGTLMFEGCLQALSIYLAALGYTIDRDGWRFEPVPEMPYHLRCRGQALPSSKEVVYEVFIDEIIDGPQPTLVADLLGTVDGLKAFHCRRMALRLVPAWPMDPHRLEVPIASDEGTVATIGEFPLGQRSLLACALGRPTEAFGAMYAAFDGPRRVARLPGPPYHFMSRIARVAGAAGALEVGSVVEAIYEVPRDAWYFDAGPRQVMPYAVLLEVALQPCGWLASYVGCASNAPEDLVFRNLDGTGVVHREVTPEVNALTTTSKLTSLSRAGGLIIVGFQVNVRAGEDTVYSLDTVFGFFPPASMKDQTGLATSAEMLDALAAASEVRAELAEAEAAYFGGALALARAPLLMIDRVTGLWPEGGPARLGRIRAEKDVDPRDWFFRAHFFQDPVQPGSLGLEAMLQVLQAFVIEQELGANLPAPGFEPIAAGESMSWKYRGQVVPEARRVVIDLEVTSIERSDNAVAVFADGSLWADGKRIYEVRHLGVRVCSGAGARRAVPDA